MSLARVPLTRKAPLLSNGKPLDRGRPIPKVSAKRAAANRVRSAVAKSKANGERPLCVGPGPAHWADDWHEPATRGRMGGRLYGPDSITDPENMQPICRAHHREVTNEEPAWAYDIGLLRHSWGAQ